MKKLLFFFLLLATGLIAHSQSKTFLGLTLGKTYTEREFRTVIEKSTSGAYEVLSWSDRIESIKAIAVAENSESASFAAEMLLPITVSVYPAIPRKGRPKYFFSLSSKNELRTVGMTYDESCGLPSLVYWHLADSLSALYPMQPIDDGIGMICYDADGMTVSLNKEENHVSLLYSDNKHIEMAINSLLPDIQDKFFGLKLGHKYSVADVRARVGTKGSFEGSRRQAVGTVVAFSDVAYAGKIWHYGEFMLTDEGELAKFSIYDSLDDYYDERKEAKGIYERFKESLDKKYSSAIYPDVEDDGTDMSASYRGANGIYLKVYNRRAKSEGGLYRRYVGIDYTHIGINNRTIEINESEL